VKKKYIILAVITALLIAACASYDEEISPPLSTPVSDGVKGETDAPEPPREITEEPEGSDAVADVAPAVSSGTRGAASESRKDTLEYFMEEGDDDGGSFATAPRTVSRGDRAPSSSGLKAGFADDNKQYGYFVDFLKEYYHVPHYDLDVAERIIFRVEDSQSKPVANAKVVIELAGQSITRGVTMADGTFQFNPSPATPAAARYQALITAGPSTQTLQFDRDGIRSHTMRLDRTRDLPDPIPLDILFIFDTTGSMGEEIHRLRATIELIHLNLTAMSTRPAIRFGMVLYKDTGDEYDTMVVPLTSDLEKFSASLNLVEASGGGDTPEDLQAALESSLRDIEWNADGIRLGFIITDAPPHLDYGQEFTYAVASEEARERGIKFFSVGTSGLPLSGEYVLRQIAQYTGGKYIFLTYGEEGESEGGEPGSVSHHTGTNYQTDKLEAIIIRFTKEELAHLTDEPLEEDDPYFQAIKIASEEREETLEKLFRMAVDQLSDYSTYSMTGGAHGSSAVAAILPLEPSSGELNIDAEYFTEQMMIAVGEESGFTLVDRSNIEEVMNELKLQLSGLTDAGTVAEVGKLLNAQVLITGKLYMPDDYELFLRLLRVETGEVLSVTKAVIDGNLGLAGR
jgi:Mg-chelatase subunit ChlD